MSAIAGPKQRAEDDPARMSASFAVFNLHVNNAGERADAEFVALFGQKHFDRYIAPHKDGIMAILGDPGWYATIWGHAGHRLREREATPVLRRLKRRGAGRA